MFARPKPIPHTLCGESSRDADVNNNREHPLRLAIIERNYAQVASLLNMGTTVNIQHKLSGNSPLIDACQQDQFNIVRLLVGFEANIGHRNKSGSTAFLEAIKFSKNRHLLDYLLRHGADVASTDKNGYNILFIAVEEGNPVSLKFALDHRIAISPPGEDSAIFLANSVQILSMLDGHGADMREKNHVGRSILHTLVQSQGIECIKFILEKGLLVLDKDDFGITALDFARERGREDILNLLIEAAKKELPLCDRCEEAPAHVKLFPCRHQNACINCCGSWKKCICGTQIERSLDILGSNSVKRKSAEPEAAICNICEERLKSFAFDCGHTSCKECSEILIECHICRQKISKKIKIFL